MRKDSEVNIYLDLSDYIQILCVGIVGMDSLIYILFECIYMNNQRRKNDRISIT